MSWSKNHYCRLKLNHDLNFQQKEISFETQVMTILERFIYRINWIKRTVSGFINESDNEQMTKFEFDIKKNIYYSYLSEMDIKS